MTCVQYFPDDNFANKDHALIECRDGTLVSYGFTHAFRVFDLKDMEIIREIRFSDRRARLSHITTHMTRLHDGLFISANFNQFHLWDLQRAPGFECIRSINSHSFITIMIIELSDHRLASYGNDKLVRIWDLTLIHNELVHVLSGHTEHITGIVELNDTMIASCSRDNTIMIWELINGTCIQTLTGHTQRIICFIKLRNGRLVSGSHDDTIRIWEFENDMMVARHLLECHCDGIIEKIIELHDGNIASCFSDKTVRIWDTTTGECLKVINTSTSIRDIFESSDGNLIAHRYSRDVYVINIRESTCKQLIRDLPGYIEHAICYNECVALSLYCKGTQIWKISKPAYRWILDSSGGWSLKSLFKYLITRKHDKNPKAVFLMSLADRYGLTKDILTDIMDQSL